MAYETRSLAECAAFIVDNRGRTCPVGADGIPLIATNCLRSGSLYPTYETERYVSPETYSTWFRAHPRPGDIIFVTKGSPGRVCLAPDPVDFCIAQDMVAIRANEEIVYPRYLFALLRSKGVQDAIVDMHVGTLIPHFKKGDFDKLQLPILSSPEQRIIGDLYFDLSHRIELLAKTNATLEAIAQALFKSWFVDFDPVRAKAEGREPEGMDAATAALFPSEFEDSELGPIPLDWRCGQLGDVLTLVTERAKAGPTTECLPYVPIEAIPNKSIILGHAMPGQLAQSSLILFRANDILFGAMRPYFHKVVSAPFDGVTRTTVFVLRPEKEARCFALLAASQASTVEFATSHSHGSTIPYARWAGSLDGMPLVIPSLETMRAFDCAVAPLLEAGAANAAKQRMLAGIRDALLPRLISGKLSLPTSDEIAQEVK